MSQRMALCYTLDDVCKDLQPFCQRCLLYLARTTAGDRPR